MAGRAISLMNVAIIVGLIFLMALRPSKPAPTARSAIGVAVCATLVTVFKTRGGSSIFSREKWYTCSNTEDDRIGQEYF